MEMNRDIKVDDSKYDLQDLERSTTASSYNSTTGSLRNFALSNAGSTFTTAPVTTNHGLVSLVQSSTLSTISSIQSIDGDRSIDEQRELSKLSETLSETILHCCELDAHNRAQELQIERFDTHTNKNSLTIERMFRTEIQTARQLLENASHFKPDLEKKLKDIHQTTLANDEHYQQLLAKRNTASSEIFNYQRQLAQNRAESEFLRCRTQYFNEEIQFYTLKNSSLEARQIKLHYELDEEIFAKQVLQMELEVLENEKITNEDIHLASIDDVRGSVDITQIASIQPSQYYRDQLIHHSRRMRSEYEKKIQTYRDELNRKFDLEFHRFQMYRLRSTPNITKEQEQKLEQYKREKKDMDQQTGSLRGRIDEIRNQIEILEKQIIEETKFKPHSLANSQRHLKMLEQIIYERERQLNEANNIRKSLKQQIEKYSHDVHRYSSQTIQKSYKIEQSTVSKPIKSILRSSSQEIKLEINQHQQQQLSSKKIQLHSSTSHLGQIEETPLLESPDFDVQQDCEKLNKIFNEPNIDEIAVIVILCNRNVAQRLQIRDTYKKLFGQNLHNLLQTSITGNSKTILKILLLSPIERDCYELHRVLKEANEDENILIEILLSRSNKQIKTIVGHYPKLFNNTIEQDIIDDEDTASKQIFLALLQGNRPEDDDHIDNEKLKNDARNLYETNSKWRRDGSTFIRLLCSRSNEQLKQIFDIYQQFGRMDIEQFIRMEKDADLSHTLMAIIRFVRNPSRFFAYEIRKSLKATGTNEDNLTRIIVSRCEIDIVQIKSEYEKIAKRTLFDHIQTNTSGDYKRVLLELLRKRIEPKNKDLSFKQFLEPPEVTKKTRPTVQWKDPTNKKLFSRSQSDRNISDIKPFDSDNQAKSNSILTIHPRLKTNYIPRHQIDLMDNQDD